MKRVMCVMLVVLIAFAGCYDVEIDKLTDLPISDKPPEVPKQNKGRSKATQTSGSRGWMNDWDMITKLGWRMDEVERVLRETQITPRPDEALLARIADIEAALELQRAEERAEKLLLVRIAELEGALESQRAEIESSENVYRLYEVAIDSQKVTIESLEKLCRMYEAEIESQGKSRSSEESPLGKEPEAGQHQGHEQDSQSNGVGLPKRL